MSKKIGEQQVYWDAADACMFSADMNRQMAFLMLAIGNVPKATECLALALESEAHAAFAHCLPSHHRRI